MAGLSDRTLRLGVTGLARSGKTLFVTSLIANLRHRDRLNTSVSNLVSKVSITTKPRPDVSRAPLEGKKERLDSQPPTWRRPTGWIRNRRNKSGKKTGSEVSRFPFEKNMERLNSPPPTWPDPTDELCDFRLTIEYKVESLASVVMKSRKLHIEFVDYPGEWLLDARVNKLDYKTWSVNTIRDIENRSEAAEFLSNVRNLDPTAPYDKTVLENIAESYAQYLTAARDAGYVDCVPGRMVRPGNLAGSPMVTFAPLNLEKQARARGKKETLWREMERRFNKYKTKHVRPFVSQRLQKIERQVILVDALGALSSGRREFEQTKGEIDKILTAIWSGWRVFFRKVMPGWKPRINKIAVVATKADGIPVSQHQRLVELLKVLTESPRAKCEQMKVDVKEFAIASLRTTESRRRPVKGVMRDGVEGKLEGEDDVTWIYPGELPDAPSELLGKNYEWPELDLPGFGPDRKSRGKERGLPNYGMPELIEYLVGDLIGVK